MSSPKQQGLDRKIVSMLSGKPLKAAKLLMQDAEIRHLQEYANTVSIKRLHYNDHGPVHMRKVTVNALQILELLHKAKIPLSLEREEIGTFEDSTLAVLIGAFLHDIGMTIGREDHEKTGALITTPIIERILKQIYPDDFGKRVILRSLAVEAIMGHMGTQKIHSLEAGTILVADGCDMEQGRARIPLMIETESHVGDIHKYSSSSVKSVTIEKGSKKPVKKTVMINQFVRFLPGETGVARKIRSKPEKGFN